MAEHVECYFKYCEALFRELEAVQERERCHCPEKPLGDQERSKRMRIEESTFLVTSVPRLEVEQG